MTKISKTAPSSGPKPTLVFFGNERLATGTTTTAPVLRGLIAAGYPIACIILSYERGVSRTSSELEITNVAKEFGIPILLPQKMSELLNTLPPLGASAGILVAFGKIVPQSVIDIFPWGIINIHPSALPLHRGPTPIESVLLDGSKQTAISIMQLTKKMDAGPIYAQQLISLEGKDTKQELADKIIALSAKLLIKTLPRILNGTLTPITQTDAGATYDKLIQKADGIIDWSKPADRIEREIRAYAGWPKSRTIINGKDIVVTSGHVAKNGGQVGSTFIEDASFGFYCGEDALVIDTLVPAGKNEMTASAFLAGYRHLLEQSS